MFLFHVVYMNVLIPFLIVVFFVRLRKYEIRIRISSWLHDSVL